MLNRETKPFPKKCKSQCNNSDSASFWITKEHRVQLSSAQLQTNQKDGRQVEKRPAGPRYQVLPLFPSRWWQKLLVVSHLADFMVAQLGALCPASSAASCGHVTTFCACEKPLLDHPLQKDAYESLVLYPNLLAGT